MGQIVSVAVVIMVAVGAAAQEGVVGAGTEGTRVAGAAERVIEPEIREIASAARSYLEAALDEDDSNIRWYALRTVRNLKSSWVADVVLPLCESPNLIERVLALEVVTNTDAGAGRSAFLLALKSGERSVRLRGVLGLAKVGDPDTVPQLVAVLKDDADPDLRAEAARALGKIADSKASIPLYEATASSYQPVREQAVLALLDMGEKGVGDYLVGRLVQDEDPGQVEILRLLALVPVPEVIPSIAPFLDSDVHEIRTAASTAIISILERSRAPRR